MCLSYSATLEMLSRLAELHKVPIKEWIAEDAIFKFIGDNVDKHVGVRDVRSDNHGQLIHMYSILAVRSRLPKGDLSRTGTVGELSKLQFRKLLPSSNFSLSAGVLESIRCLCDPTWRSHVS